MIIYPAEYLDQSIGELVASLNMSPKAGDDGHTDDHAVISQALLTAPISGVSLGAVAKQDGQWVTYEGTGQPSLSPAEFSDVKVLLESPGMVGISMFGEHPAADGVTDWSEDSPALDGVQVNLFAAGALGAAHAARLLVAQVNHLESRLAALEAAQA